MYIKCGENEYRITGANNDNLPNTICIKSVLKKSKDGKYVNGNIVLVEEEIKHVKKMLELNNDGVVKVDSVSDKSFEVPTLEQPNSNVTSHNATQQVVNNDSNETEVKQASGSTTTGLTEQLPEVNSTQELSTPNNEPVKIDTPDQPKSPAVPSEPQETLVNAHEEKGKPDNAEGVQPEVSNEEVTIESGEFFDAEEEVATEPNEFFDAEDDGVTQPKSLTTDMVVEQADTPNQLIPSAVPNKSQDNSIVIDVIVIPEGAKLKFFPEISDFLSRASLEREISFCKAPNSLLVQTREEQAASNDLSHKSQSL